MSRGYVFCDIPLMIYHPLGVIQQYCFIVNVDYTFYERCHRLYHRRRHPNTGDDSVCYSFVVIQHCHQHQHQHHDHRDDDKIHQRNLGAAVDQL